MKVQEAFDNWIESHKKDFPQGISAMDKIMFKAGYESALSDIEKCEQVNTHDYAYLVEEAIQRSVSNSSQPLRDLGVYLSKLLDEDQWSTAEQYLLKAALTTHQPIEKSEPVGYLIESPDGIRVFFDSPVHIHNHTITPLYTSPISKECEPINEVYAFEKWLKENTLIRASLNIDLDYADPLAEIAYRAWKARAKLNAPEKG